MQLCWNPTPEARPTSTQVHALIHHLYSTPRTTDSVSEPGVSSATAARLSADFEQRWQRLKPNTIPTRDEHRAIVHAPSITPQFAGSDDNMHTIQDSLSIEMDTAVSRSSSIMSDKDPLSIQIKSESLTNLHGSLEDVRNIYLTHNEMAVLECHQGNIGLEEAREREQDRSDASMDPWLKDIIAGSTDDVSYYKDVSDVIKNLDNILNSEKTSSSESSHQASPSRDNLSLDCKKDYPVQSSMVKSPGITNFQSILDTGFSTTEDDQTCEDDEIDRDTIGTLSHSFERHSEIDTTSQHTLENLTPDTPIKDIDVVRKIEIQAEVNHPKDTVVDNVEDNELPNEIVSSVSEIPMLKELCVASIPSASDEQCVKDCQTSCDSNLKSTDYKEETKSIDDVVKVNVTPQGVGNKENVDLIKEVVDVLPKPVEVITSMMQDMQENLPGVKEGKVIDEQSMTNYVSITEVLVSDLIKEKPEVNCPEDDRIDVEEQIPESVQSKDNESTNTNIEETETPFVLKEEETMPLPPEIVQNIFKEENVIEQETDLESTSANDSFAKESTVEEEISDKVIEAEDVAEEDLISDYNTNESEKQTVSEVSEYTKWINFASTPERIQEVSDFIRSEREHMLRTEVKSTADENISKGQNEDDFEVFSPEECLEASMAESLNLEHLPTNDFSEDSLMKESVKDVNKVLSEEVTGENTLEIKVLVDKAESSEPTKQEENLISVDIENKQSTETPISEKSEHNVTEIIETVSDNSDNVLTEVFSINKSDQDDVTVKEEKEIKPVEYVSETHIDVDELKTLPMQNRLDILEDKISKLDHTVLTEEEVKTVCEEPSVQEIVELDQDYPTRKDESHQSPVKEQEKFQQHINDVHETAKAIIDEIVEVKIEQLNLEEAISNKDEKATVKDTSIPKDIAEDKEIEDTHRSESPIKQKSDDSTVYMDLINETNAEVLTNNDTVDDNVRDVIKSCLETTNTDKACSLENNESTEYLDLPSFGIKDVDHFLHMEKVFSSHIENVVSSTPLASDTSNTNNTLENSVKEKEDSEAQLFSETKVPNYGPGVSLTKLEQKFVPDSMSPFESPTKSHPTDTYDENSSVVLGPFENCTLEFFKGVKSSELVDLPKEELLAFSSNFSEINLETPSPLRDGNFLNEVPDIIHDDIQFDDIQSASEKPPSDPTESESINSGTEKRISPSTPPNSPGIFLASTSQQKYLVDIDLTPEVRQEPDLSLQKEIELNQIELQITSKLAMAENENNMNIEYSGPLTVEGVVSDEGMLLRESDALPESYLAGNGGSMEDLREDLTLDEECVKALRNELELKLPLAQVSKFNFVVYFDNLG